MEQVSGNLHHCYNQLSIEGQLITANAIKSRFVGQDERHRTLFELVAYHNENRAGALTPGTLKNYFTTEKYLKRFLKERKKTRDIYLKQINYAFIIDL